MEHRRRRCFSGADDHVLLVRLAGLGADALRHRFVGGGPAGYVAAERAGSAGLSVVLFEKKAMGGVCLNEGCIPTKTLLYSAKTYENALLGDKYGVFADNVRFDYGRMVSRKKKVVRKLVLGVESKMKSNKVTVVKGEAVIHKRSYEGIEIDCNNEK